jgi:hyperosmotically inducible protein
MKSTQKLLCGSIVLLMSMGAYAQGTSTEASGSMGMSAKHKLHWLHKSPADKQLAKSVHQALNHTKGLMDSEIAVFADAESGKVTLSGDVASADQDKLAQDAAQKVAGVKEVVSKLTIHEEGQ